MDNRDVIVIGASAGGLGALRKLLGGLPGNLPAAVFVVVHRGEEEPSLLAELLDAVGPLPAETAEEGQIFRHGRIYVSPADRHLLVGRDHIHVRRGPRENRSRPAIDPLFRSAAASCSTRVIGIVLSGMLDDGASGLLAIRRCGGLAIVQAPEDAEFPEMPSNALRRGNVDQILPVREMPALLVELVRQPRPPAMDPPDDVRLEAMIPAMDVGDSAGKLGRLSPLTCPDCHGVIYEIEENGALRYRCHTGHAFGTDSLRAAQDEVLERALYDAMRTQVEQALLAQRIAQENRHTGNARGAEWMERRAASYREGAETLRRLIAANGAGTEAI
ncbi:MAG: chemotaxis protein CheB [Geminicoccaceae bacterium]